MNRILKFIGYILTTVLLIAAAFLVYLLRGQEIDIGLISNEFTYCGRQINSGKPEYVKITNWLKHNRNGWTTSYASYVPGNEYLSPAFNVSVHSDFVLVWYKTDEGYTQFIKYVKHELPLTCP